MPQKEVLRIVQGSALLYYCHDVGTTIDLDALEKALGERASRSSLALERIQPSAIQFRKRPLLVRLGQLRVSAALQVEATAKLYDFGAITIRLKVPLAGSFDSLRKSTGNLSQNALLAKAAAGAFAGLRHEIETHIIDAYKNPDSAEDYTIVHIEHFDKQTGGSALLAHHAETIAHILRCDGADLSHDELNDALRNPLAYYKGDLAIIDSNAAFIYSPRHEYDVHDVIEYAIIEMLELKHYDNALDDVLEHAYADINRGSLSLNPFRKEHEKLVQVRLDVTETIEKVENTLKIIGDSYLAKVYARASERLGMREWKESVRSKLTTITEVYNMLSNRISGTRLLMLEIIVALSSAVYILEFLFSHWK
jgi:hypothetical protein